MTGSMIVNNLAGLMMLTSLFVISVKSYRLSCGFYACQSLVLVSIFATLSCLFVAEQLLIWSASAFITKVLLVPLIMISSRNTSPCKVLTSSKGSLPRHNVANGSLSSTIQTTRYDVRCFLWQTV